MKIKIIERRFVAAMLSGLSVGATVAALLYLLWPASIGGLPPVLLAFMTVMGLAAGSFGSLIWLNQMTRDG